VNVEDGRVFFDIEERLALIVSVERRVAGSLRGVGSGANSGGRAV